MRSRWEPIVVAFIVAGSLAWGAAPTGAEETAPATAAFANDLGPSDVDVSEYPPRMQTIYRENFKKNCTVCHSAARALNSEFLEIDAAEATRLRQTDPALFDDPTVLLPGRDVWKRYIKKMKMRPPCCGTCPTMTFDQSREIWEFLVYDSRARKTGTNARAWQARRRELLRRFAESRPQDSRQSSERGKQP